MQRIRHVFDVTMPASPTVLTLISLLWCRTLFPNSLYCVNCRCVSLICWSRQVYHSSRQSDTEIRGKITKKLTILINQLFFFCRQPKRYARQFFRNCHNIQQVLKTLQIASIVPAKIRFISRADKLYHTINPRYGAQPVSSFFMCFLHARIRIISLKRIASVTNTTLYLCSLEPTLQSLAEIP